jgi:hypothetical protein
VTLHVVPDPVQPQRERFGELTAEQRFDTIRTLHREAEQRRLTACVLLAEAHDAEDWQTLGFDTFGDYARAIGIPSASTASKMLAIGKCFAPKTDDGPRQAMWCDRPAADQASLSVEGLYEASRNVRVGAVETVAEALHDAISMPVHAIIEKRRGVERVPCDCPHCGNHHYREDEA